MTSLSRAEFAQNPDPRIACLLLLDTSTSMTDAPIDELNAGIRTLHEELLADKHARKRTEVAIVTFGGSPNIVQDFTTVDAFQPPVLNAEGGTPMGAAIMKGLDLLEARKRTYDAADIKSYRPWAFLITDGYPTDSWSEAAERVHQYEAEKRIALFAIGTEGADFETLGQIAKRDAMKLQGIKFREFFLWLSRSLSKRSGSAPGDQIAFEPSDDWAVMP